MEIRGKHIRANTVMNEDSNYMWSESVIDIQPPTDLAVGDEVLIRQKIRRLCNSGRFCFGDSFGHDTWLDQDKVVYKLPSEKKEKIKRVETTCPYLPSSVIHIINNLVDKVNSLEAK